MCVCWRQVNSSLIQNSQGCVCTHDPLGFSAASVRGDSSPRIHQGMKGSLCSPSAPEHHPFSLPFLCVESSRGTAFPSCTHYPNSLLFSRFLCILDAHLKHMFAQSPCFHQHHTQNNFLLNMHYEIHGLHRCIFSLFMWRLIHDLFFFFSWSAQWAPWLNIAYHRSCAPCSTGTKDRMELTMNPTSIDRDQIQSPKSKSFL